VADYVQTALKMCTLDHYKTRVLNPRPAFNHFLTEASHVMSVRLESALSLIDVLTVCDSQIRRVDAQSINRSAQVNAASYLPWDGK